MRTTLRTIQTASSHETESRAKSLGPSQALDVLAVLLPPLLDRVNTSLSRRVYGLVRLDLEHSFVVFFWFYHALPYVPDGHLAL